MPFVSHEKCQPFYPDYVLKTNMLCAGDLVAGKLLDSDDQGAPLLVKENGVTKLAGLATFKSVFAKSGEPIVFLNIAAYADWIADTKNDLTTPTEITAESLAKFQKIGCGSALAKDKNINSANVTYWGRENSHMRGNYQFIGQEPVAFDPNTAKCEFNVPGQPKVMVSVEKTIDNKDVLIAKTSVGYWMAEVSGWKRAALSCNNAGIHINAGSSTPDISIIDDNTIYSAKFQDVLDTIPVLNSAVQKSCSVDDVGVTFVTGTTSDEQEVAYAVVKGHHFGEWDGKIIRLTGREVLYAQDIYGT